MILKYNSNPSGVNKARGEGQLNGVLVSWRGEGGGAGRSGSSNQSYLALGPSALHPLLGVLDEVGGQGLQGMLGQVDVTGPWLSGRQCPGVSRAGRPTIVGW